MANATYYTKPLSRLIEPSYHLCPGCNTRKALVHFRKFWNGKRVMRTLCRVCEPEKSVKDMTPEQRERALAAHHPQITPERVEYANAKDAANIHNRRSQARLAQHQRERTLHWGIGITDALRTEMWWARKNKLITQAIAKHTPHQGQPWADFFEGYENVLRDMLTRIRQRIGRRMAETSKGKRPTEEELNPYTWTNDATLRRLRELYSACPVLRGRRLYRDPEFLKWTPSQPLGEADEIRRT